MSILAPYLSALGDFIQPIMLFHVAWATLLGIFIGSLPGLTATMGVALLTTLTYSMDRDAAILVLICMYVGAIYGGRATRNFRWSCSRTPAPCWAWFSPCWVSG